MNDSRLPSLATLGALGALLASSLVLSGCGEANASAQKLPIPEPIRVTSLPAVSKVIASRLEVTGSLVADESAEIAAERDGRVADVLVERGSYVNKGEVLARIDTAEAKAQLDEAKASLAWAESESSRYAELRDKQVVARAERERKGIDLDLARARLTLAQKAFDDCVIRAPFSGLVAEKRVSAGAFVRRGAPVALLMKIDPLRAELSVAESAIPAVKLGQSVSFTVQSFPGKVFEGKVAHIGPSVDARARSLVVEALVPNPARLLKPGLFVTAGIEMPTSTPAIFAPRSSIVTQSGVSRVFVLGAERVEERVVSLGREAGDLVELRTGVAEGEKLVLRPTARLTDGLLIAR
ncbi:MAG: efflux RND transporter periplasmic adaptor subunit [Acidobacteria bacterium]|nr:efflux RND transporter periplasmic adaptor subunit [Acidobacteriota bacterium]